MCTSPVCWQLAQTGVVELPDTARPPLTLAPCTSPVPHEPAHCPSPEVGLQHPVQALVEGSGGEVSCPVVILPVRIGEEIPSENWEPGWPHPRHDAHFLVQGIKVVRERAKLCLQDSTCSPEPGLLQWELLSPLSGLFTPPTVLCHSFLLPPAPQSSPHIPGHGGQAGS